MRRQISRTWQQKKGKGDNTETTTAGTYPLCVRYLAAALLLAMLPAGEMWSVVTESPRYNKTWAFSMGCRAIGSLVCEGKRKASNSSQGGAGALAHLGGHRLCCRPVRPRCYLLTYCLQSLWWPKLLLWLSSNEACCFQNARWKARSLA